MALLGVLEVSAVGIEVELTTVPPEVPVLSNVGDVSSVEVVDPDPPDERVGDWVVFKSDPDPPKVGTAVVLRPLPGAAAEGLVELSEPGVALFELFDPQAANAIARNRKRDKRENFLITLLLLKIIFLQPIICADMRKQKCKSL
jgi:hypothetical protein